MRHVSKIICLAIAVLVAWKAYILMDGVFEPFWISYAAAGGITILIYSLLYFPLLRPIADIVSDGLSTTAQRFKSNQTGVGLDDIPIATRETTRSVSTVCGICGKPSNTPACESCRKKMSK